MFGEALVQEGVTGGEEIGHVSVTLKDTFDEEFGFLSESLAQVVVEIGVGADVGREGFQVAEVEPLAGEVGDEGAGFGVGQHAAGLGLELRGGVEALLLSGGEELVVGNAAPEEEGEAAGEVYVGNLVGRFRGEPCRVAFDAEEEVGAGEEGAEGHFDAVVEALSGTFSIEAEEGLDFGFGDGAAPGAACLFEEDAFSAGVVFGRGGGVAAEDAPASGGITCGGFCEGSGDADGVDSGLDTGVSIHIEAGLVGLAFGFGERV